MMVTMMAKNATKLGDSLEEEKCAKKWGTSVTKSFSQEGGFLDLEDVLVRGIQVEDEGSVLHGKLTEGTLEGWAWGEDTCTNYGTELYCTSSQESS